MSPLDVRPPHAAGVPVCEGEVADTSGIGTVTVAPDLPFAPALRWWKANFRLSETIVMGYFLYTALWLTLVATPDRKAASWIIPLTICGVLLAESRMSRPWSRVVRDWGLLGLILGAYWQLEWFSGAPILQTWQDRWIRWDRFLLDDLGFRGAVEIAGPLIPSGLELVYFLLYAIPTLCLGILYFRLRRTEVNRFLAMLFLGTLTAYALLPHFPTVSPRVAFAGTDLPHYSGVWRSINIWILDHGDISTSVFPSGHVAVAFSSAFGLLRAVPYRRGICAGVFVAAGMVFAATIYSRYHYAADGLASIAICVLAWRLSEVIDPHD